MAASELPAAAPGPGRRLGDRRHRAHRARLGLTLEALDRVAGGNLVLEGLALLAVGGGAALLIGSPVLVGLLTRVDRDQAGRDREEERQRFAAHLRGGGGPRGGGERRGRVRDHHRVHRDRPLDRAGEALAAAAREALRNTARHGAGAPVLVAEDP